MATPYIIACKELNGIIYLARLPQTVDAQTPGVPDTGSGGPWFAVGPGIASIRPRVLADWRHTAVRFDVRLFVAHVHSRD